MSVGSAAVARAHSTPMRSAYVDESASILFAVTSKPCIHAKRTAHHGSTESQNEVWVRLSPEDGVKVDSVADAENQLLNRSILRVPKRAPLCVAAMITEHLAEVLGQKRIGLANHTSLQPLTYVLMHPALLAAIQPWGHVASLHAPAGSKEVGRWTKSGSIGEASAIYTSGSIQKDEFVIVYNGRTGSPRLIDGPAVLFDMQGELFLTLTPTTPVTRGGVDDYIRRVQMV